MQPLVKGGLLAWERTGVVWHVLASGERAEQPVLDIRDEVQGGGDQGLLSVLLDPAFPTRPFLYALYVVDRHHLLYAGTPSYNPAANLYYQATIGRVTRYTLDNSGDSLVADLTSRTVLLGESPSDGIPVVHLSHSVGEMVFGTDGTLLISTGDSANFGAVDSGGATVNPNVADALAEGILRPEEDVGAFRAQVLNSMCGKVLRISATDGSGVPSNPWYDVDEPRSPRSRVWALGLRNPYRMSIRPGSGSHNPEDADPGTLIIGDVGSYIAEEVNVVTRAALNFGWPLFEGHRHNMQYWPVPAVHTLPTGLPVPFRDLVLHDTRGAWEHVDSTRVTQAETPPASASAAAPVQSSQGGFLGTGYRLVPSGAHVTWTEAEVPQTLPTVAFRYSTSGSSPVSAAITVNHETVAQVQLTLTGAPTDWRIARVPVTMDAGTSVPIRITKMPSTTTLLIDCMWLEGADGSPAFPSAVPTFMHCRPILTWRSSGAMTPSYSPEGAAIAVTVGTGGASAEGTSFNGACAVMGSADTPDSWPSEYKGSLFGDYVDGWIRIGAIDWSSRCGANGPSCDCQPALSAVRLFDSNLTKIVAIRTAPAHDAVYVGQWDRITRYRWMPGGSLPPEIRTTQSHEYGPSPLVVHFDASDSSDPEGDDFAVIWDFGDGSAPAMGPVASHTFRNPGDGPHGFTVCVTAKDSNGASSTKNLHVSVDNTPPRVSIESTYDGATYPALSGVTLPLAAAVEDDEETAADIRCQWQTVLFHDTHNHPEPIDPNCVSESSLQATGCDPNATYWYEISFTATDSGGLSATHTVRLNPDCRGSDACRADISGDGRVDSVDLSFLLAGWSASGLTDIDGSGTTDAADLSLLLARWGDCPPP